MKVLILALLLTGCASMKPEVVKVPVAVGCLGDKPARPTPTFGAGDYPGDAAAAKAALVDSAAWEGYAIGLEVAMSGCDPKPKD